MLKKLIKKYNDLPFKVSPLLIIYAVVFVLLDLSYQGFSYLIAVIIHEFAHADEAKNRGYILKSMSFTIFGASLKINDETMSSEDERAIAIAGPMSNLFLAIFFTALWWLFPSTYFFTMDFVWANLTVFLFNLLPVYPLDGGRVLLSYLSKKKPRAKAYKDLKIIGYILSFILFICFIVLLVFKVLNVSFLLVGIFIITSTIFPDHSCSYQRLYATAFLSKRLDKCLPIKEIAVKENTTIKRAYSLLSMDYYTCFVIVNERLSPTFVISESDLAVNIDKVNTLGELAKILYAKKQSKFY